MPKKEDASKLNAISFRIAGYMKTVSRADEDQVDPLLCELDKLMREDFKVRSKEVRGRIRDLVVDGAADMKMGSVRPDSDGHSSAADYVGMMAQMILAGQEIVQGPTDELFGFLTPALFQQMLETLNQLK